MKFLLPTLFTIISFWSFSQEKVTPFAPELMSQYQNVRDFTINNAETEAYFTIQSPLGEVSTIVSIRKNNNQWSQPEIVSFSGTFHDLEPFLAPDGLTLYFASNRPIDINDTNKDYDIWYVTRPHKKASWSSPVNMGTTINSSHNEFYPSVGNSKNLYFTSDRPNDSKGKDDIFISKWSKGNYTSPKSLSTNINTEGYEFNAYISPDESFLIFSGYKRKDGLGSGDLYISYNNNNTWTKAENLSYNSKYMDYCPYVNNNTKTLYYTSKRSSVASPKEGFKNISELTSEINKPQNGLSRIYHIDFSPYIK